MIHQLWEPNRWPPKHDSRIRLIFYAFLIPRVSRRLAFVTAKKPVLQRLGSIDWHTYFDRGLKETGRHWRCTEDLLVAHVNARRVHEEVLHLRITVSTINRTPVNEISFRSCDHREYNLLTCEPISSILFPEVASCPLTLIRALQTRLPALVFSDSLDQGQPDRTVRHIYFVSKNFI